MSHNPRLLPVTLNGTSYAVEPSRFDRGFLPSRAEQVEQSDGPPRLNPFGHSRFEITDWSLGAGQEFQDIETSTGRRFWKGFGVDVFTDRGKLKLATTYTNTNAVTGTTGSRDILRVPTSGEWYFLYDSTTVKFAQLSGLSPATDCQIQAGESAEAVEAITTDGTDYVYAAVGVNGIHRTAVGASTSSHFATMTTGAGGVWYVKGRLIAFDGLNGSGSANRLVDVDAAGTVGGELDFSDPADTFKWTDVIEAPNGIYAAGYVRLPSGVGFTSRVYYIGIGADGTLDEPVLADSLPFGTRIVGLYYAGGPIVYNMVSGVRVAVINGDNTLTHGPLVQSVIDAAAPWPGSRTFFQSDNQFFGVNDADSTAGLFVVEYRFDEFVEPLAPAYAYTQLVSSDTDDTITSIISSHVATEEGIFESSSVLVSSGYVTSGWIRYGVTEPKIPRAISLRLEEALPAGASVAVAIIEEDGTETTVGTYSTQGGLGPDAPYSITTVGKGEKFRVKVTLNRATDTTDGPTVASVTLYSTMVPNATEQFVLPIRLFEQVDTEAGTMLSYDVSAELTALRNLRRNRDAVTLEIGGESFTVTVDDVKFVPSEDSRWSDDGATLEGIYAVTCRTADVQAA